MDIVEYKNYLVDWLKKCVNDSNTKGLIVGVSGGIDSALVANLIKEAFPDNHLGVIIPIESANDDVVDACELVNACNIKHLQADLNDVYKELLKIMEYDKNTTKSNLKARLRMIQLYALASENNYLVVGTDNKCEWYTGYFTKYGDGGVDIAPLIHLDKLEVYEMAKIYNIPKSIIEKSPNAGLGSSLTDEEEMGVSYNTLCSYLKGKSIDENDKMIIEKLHNNSKHKRNGITCPDKKYL